MTPGDYDDASAGSSDAKEFVDEFLFVWHVFTGFKGPDQVECVGREWLIECVCHLVKLVLHRR